MPPRETPAIKSISMLTREDGLTHAQFVKDRVEVHAPLALAVPGMRRYVQSHIVEERKRPDIPATDVDIDGIAEVWYDDRETMAKAVATPEAKALFADPARRGAGAQAVKETICATCARQFSRWH